MIRSMLRRLMNPEFDDLLSALTTAQYLSPHEPLSAALQRAVDGLKVCPQAVNHAVAWLAVDPATPIGRLRRTELVQLARSIYRFWRQSGAMPATATVTTTPAAQRSERQS